MSRLAYFDCHSGISGDMTLAALIDAGAELEKLNDALGSLGLPGLKLQATQVKKAGYRATQVSVLHQPEHGHRHLHHIVKLIETSVLSDRQKALALRIFRRLAEAEAHVHGTTIEKVHFHEVGAADSIADIVGTAVALDLLGIQRVVASPVVVGHGTVRIAHGLCSVPAPATAELLRGIPIAQADVEGELTTPTGAAILAALAEGFGPLPAMVIEQVGCGAGQKDLPDRANVLRVLVGRSRQPAAAPAGTITDQVCLLETNLDDVSSELIGYCLSRLWEAGALDVYTTAIQMKKGRPGVLLSVLCRPDDAPTMEEIIFAETSTLGIRRSLADRHILPRQSCTVQTTFGPVEGKVAMLVDGAKRFSPEYESCRAIAAEQKLPLRVVYEAAMRAFDSTRQDS